MAKKLSDFAQGLLDAQKAGADQLAEQGEFGPTQTYVRPAERARRALARLEEAAERIVRRHTVEAQVREEIAGGKLQLSAEDERSIRREVARRIGRSET